MTVWKQQRPEWCPHSDCAYRASSQGCICVGELPTPAPHLDDFNTHRLCIAQSCPGDDEWLFKLEINRSDAWGMTRVLDRAFSASADTHPKDGDVKQAPLVSGAVPQADAQRRSHDD